MLYLSNGKVAWLIPDNVEGFYRTCVYRPPKGWSVVSHHGVTGWKTGKGGELRKPCKARKKRR
jgi:hypothetical protein